jgi:hypothetical protein
MKSRARALLDKSIGAMISAIEVYNKPSFRYREETFSVLAINAWSCSSKRRRPSFLPRRKRNSNAKGGIASELLSARNTFAHSALDASRNFAVQARAAPFIAANRRRRAQ